MGAGFETLGRILTSMLSFVTRLRKAEIHTFVSEERKLYDNYSMSPMPQKLIASYSIRQRSSNGASFCFSRGVA